LPEDCVPDGSGNPLNRRPEFVNTVCPRCAKPARRETDTMDTFVDSSWYFLRYACSDQHDKMVDERVGYWLPVDQYIGGIEHAILHLLYSRFWTKVMRDLGLIKLDEPFTNLLTQGMVLNHIFQRKSEKGGISYFAPDEVTVSTDADGRVTGATANADGQPVDYAGVGTMSKSKRNGVDPQELIERYGADTARFFIIFTSPPEQTLAWSDAGVDGSFRFLNRVWTLAAELAEQVHAESAHRNGACDGYQYPAGWQSAAPELARARRELHTHLRQASYDMQRQQFNTVASAAMKIYNALSGLPRGSDSRAPGAAQLVHEGFSVLLRVLYPITPHIAHALWRELGFAGSLLDAPWPEVDETALRQDAIELVLQINGKTRGSVLVPSGASQEQIGQQALATPAARKHVLDKPVKKVVVVPGRLVNIVV
jgi:leucyl-tRNA synthetase